MIFFCHRRKSILVFLLGFIWLIFAIGYLKKQNNTYNILLDSSNPKVLGCHNISNQESLPDILSNPPNAKKRNIFFLETSCNSYEVGRIFIKARQACAVESAARMNPDMDVYLLYASPGIIREGNSESDRILNMLTKMSNVKLLHLDINRYIQDTAVDVLWENGDIGASIYPIAHTSDILRLITLWKYGGIYIDLDVIVLKKLDKFPENFGGAESPSLLSNSVLGFGRQGIGHDYIDECVKDVSVNFDGQEWSFNGPKLVTRNILARCPDLDTETVVRLGRCEDFRIFPPSAFYLIPYQNWEWFFNKNLTDVIVSNLEEWSYITHVWNKFSFSKDIPKKHITVPYLRLAAKYCPGVVEELENVF